MLAQELIRRKRDGEALDEAAIQALVAGIVAESVSEGQMAAFAMACFFQGLSADEQAQLTTAMAAAGQQLTWQDSRLDGPLLDKHSTGGVGDKVSLILAPLLAACGAYVPMISGRGLGHTGGTLDKLDSLPGYSTTPERDTLQRVVRTVGCAIVGQSSDLVPADRRLYAVRDVTATVEVPGLIVASILSKKLAAGLQGLVLDVKTGSGAFASDKKTAQSLAHSLVSTANRAGLATRALITDMNQVLGYSAGNALEIQETVDFLAGNDRNPRLHEVVMALGSELLLLGKLAVTPKQARQQLLTALHSGAGAERFAAMVHALGGPQDVFQDAGLTPAPVVQPLLPARAGYLAAMDVRAVGLAVIELGGGRRQVEDRIDHRVGLSRCRQLGDWLAADEPLAMIHAATAADATTVATRLQTAFVMADKAPRRSDCIHAAVND